MRRLVMNWDRVEGNWKTFKGQVRQQWGKLTDDDLDVIAGRREELIGRIQNAYGMARDEAEKQVTAWEKNQTLFCFTPGAAACGSLALILGSSHEDEYDGSDSPAREHQDRPRSCR